MREAPEPRFLITISVRANSMEELLDHLLHIEQTFCLDHKDDSKLEHSGTLVVGGGYSIENVFNPEMTKERYKEELMDWFEHRSEKQE